MIKDAITDLHVGSYEQMLLDYKTRITLHNCYIRTTMNNFI